MFSCLCVDKDVKEIKNCHLILSDVMCRFAVTVLTNNRLSRPVHIKHLYRSVRTCHQHKIWYRRQGKQEVNKWSLIKLLEIF